MLYTTFKCKMDGNQIVLPGGVRLYLDKDYNLFGDYFISCVRNYHGSYDLIRVLRITSENTLEEERGLN